MHGAPLDLALTLPDTWIEDVLAFRPAGSEAPFIAALQDVVRVHRERAIGLSQVHDLALRVAGLHRGQGRLALLTRLTEAAGGLWPVTLPIEERRLADPAKHVFAIAEALEAIQAEWAVLDALVHRGARPLSPSEGRRVGGAYDWTVEHDGTRVDVEVKQKASIGTAGDRIEWFWKGFSLLPGGRFLRDYRWSWHVPENATSEQAREMMDSLWEAADDLRALLPDAIAQSRGPRSFELEEDLGSDLSGGRLSVRASHFVQTPSVAIELRSNRELLVDVQVNPEPQVLVCNGLSGGWLASELDSDAEVQVARVLGRLNLGQAARRGTDGLYVIVWWVPHDWEEALRQEWLDATCERISKEQGIHHLAIWPIALFEARRLRWALSPDVARDFPWLR